MRGRIGLTLSIILFFCSMACIEQDLERQVFPKQLPHLGKSQQAVIGGKTDNRYPAIGALVDRRGNSFCTATLIAPKLLITAGHCNDPILEGMRRRRRYYFRVQVPDGNSHEMGYAEIKTVINHPDWNGDAGSGYDIGVVVLQKALKITGPMNLYTGPMDNSWRGRKILYLGYGLTSTNPLRSAREKYSTEIPLQRIRTDRFTTYKQGTSVCSGDSGGPSLYFTNNEHIIAGINSYVQGNAFKDQHGNRQSACDGTSTSMRLSKGKSWIQQQISQHGGNSCTQDSDCGPCYTCDSGTCKHKCKIGGVCKQVGSDYVCNNDPLQEEPVCGDGTCNGKENCLTCAQDCRCREGQACTSQALCKPKAVCGDGLCDDTQGENCDTCNADCYCKPKVVCGDGVCNADQGENCGTCAQDCGCQDNQECKQQQCVEKPSTDAPKNGGSQETTDKVVTEKDKVVLRLPCTIDQRVTTCDDNGKNCHEVCATDVGCSSLPSRKQPVPWEMLALFLLFLMRRQRKL